VIHVASIQTGIELNDGFTSILNNIISSVNLAVSAMENMQEALNADIDTSSLAGARSEIDQATMAVNELDQAMSELTAPAIDTIQVDAAGAGQVINVVVNPVIPVPLISNPQEIRPDVVPNAPPEPVNVPVQWRTDNLDVFTGSGAERFRQEVQSADAMLERLCGTQDAIARQAYDTIIFPPEAFQNLNSMAVRMDTLRDRIRQIENNPLNMGTDAANAELERLRVLLNQALQAQGVMNQAVEDMDVQAANEAYLRLSQIIGDTERHIRDNVDEQGNLNAKIKKSKDNAEELKKVIDGVVESLDVMAGLEKARDWIKECTEAFDIQRNAESQLMTMLVNNVETEVTADPHALTAAFDTITAKASEIQSRGVYADETMIAGATEFSTYFSDTAAIEMMMDTLADYAMGMSGGGEVDSTAMVSYATGLGEIMSGSYEAMTQKGFEFTEAQKAVIEGTATQEQVIAAIGEEYLDASHDVQAAAAINAVVAKSWDGLYESMSNTPEGKIMQMNNTFSEMKEMIGGQLYPYVILFVDAITSHWGTIQEVLDGITLGLQIMMGILSWLLEGALNFAQAVIDNWSWISPIVYGIVAALALYAVISGIVAVANGIHTVSEAAKAAAQALATGATFAETAAQQGLNAALAACPLTWVILLIIALIAVIFAVCNAIAKMTGVANSGFGVMTGGVNVVIQFFKNLGLAVANIALGIWDAIGALVNNMKTAFNNAICSVQSWWYDLLSTALTVIGGICEALNKLPFVDFDYSGITSAANEYADRAAEAAEGKKEYESVSDAFNEGFNTFDTFQDGWASDAFAAGAAWGDGIADKVGAFSLKDLFATEDDYGPGFSNTMESNGMDEDVDDIAGNTGSIKDSLGCTEEDLKYLRDIAEQEAVNRYTLAEVKVEQTNHNNINSSLDLDGVVSGLTDAVSEAVDSITEGVHE